MPAPPQRRRAAALALVAALAKSFERAGDLYPAKGVARLARRFVDVIGVDTFHEAEAAPEDLARNRADLAGLSMDRPTAEALAGSFDECGLQMRDAYLKTLEGDLSEQGKLCLDDLLTEDLVRRSFVADLLGEELDPDPLTQVQRCTR